MLFNTHQFSGLEKFLFRTRTLVHEPWDGQKPPEHIPPGPKSLSWIYNHLKKKTSISSYFKNIFSWCFTIQNSIIGIIFAAEYGIEFEY